MIFLLKSEAVLIHDAFTLLANTIDRNNLAETLPTTQTTSCQKETPWLFGMDFMRFLKMSSFKGLSGNVEFDQTTGYRNNITLSIVDRTRAGVDLVIFCFFSIINCLARGVRFSFTLFV